MYKFGEKSLAQIATLHPLLQQVLHEVIKHVDFAVTDGHRGEAEQEAAYASGASQAHFGQSPHNKTPSMGVDLAPYPVDYSGPEARERFAFLAGHVMVTAHAMGIDLTWGGDWDRDGETKDNKFDDMPHFELTDWRTL
jgi:peptidoglycan L-alanyl-D-glutamate endopeptidase CwlK